MPFCVLKKMSSGTRFSLWDEFWFTGFSYTEKNKMRIFEFSIPFLYFCFWARNRLFVARYAFLIKYFTYSSFLGRYVVSIYSCYIHVYFILFFFFCWDVEEGRFRPLNICSFQLIVKTRNKRKCPFSDSFLLKLCPSSCVSFEFADFGVSGKFRRQHRELPDPKTALKTQTREVRN